MTDEEKRLVKRLAELHDRAETRWAPCYSDFLTLAEQALHQESEPELPPNYDENGVLKAISFKNEEYLSKNFSSFLEK